MHVAPMSKLRAVRGAARAAAYDIGDVGNHMESTKGASQRVVLAALAGISNNCQIV